jgi:hypothetical protein
MKSLLIALLAAIAVVATTLAASSTADARCLRGCRHAPWPYNQWGYVGPIRSGSGLGGSADAPWVGGSITAVTSYGPRPYGLYPFSAVQ